MASVLTYKQVLDILQDIARRHYQINTFFVGENHDLNAEDLIYPVLFVRPTTAKFPQTGGEYKTVEMKLEVRVLDKQLQNGIDEPDVTNDTFRICQDVINEINQHPFYLRSNTTILGDIELSTVNEFNDDYTCGWGFDLNLQMVNTNSFCGLPMDDITGYSANGPVNTGYTIQYNYLQCNNQLSACTYLDSFIDYKIAINTGSSANYYTTGATLFGSNLIFNRNDMLSAYTVDLSPLVVTGYLSTSGGTVTGNTLFTQNLSASTFYSGSTNLYDVIETMITGVTSGLTGSVNINGLNTYTGGSIAHQSINISGLTIDNINVSGSSVFNTLTASSISATTFYSGSTNWEDIITDIVTGVTVSLVNTHVQNGLNTYTGGTADLPTVNISAATLASLSVSGSAIFNTIDVSVISGSSGSANISLTNSATTITTDDGGFLSPYVIINPSKIELAGLNTGDVTLDSNNLLINHGTKINLNAPLTQVTGSMNISGGSLSSGGTDLYNIFITTNDGNDITRVGNGLNTYTGGTANNPTVNISAATLDNLTVTGQSNFTTIYSGGTDLINIINSSVTGVTSGLTFTRVQPGLNTYTGGTADYPTVNISAATLATLTVSGATSLGVVSATTMYSGSTDMSVLFATPANITLINSQLLTKANLSGATFTGQINGTVFSAISVYGDTLYSGTTELGTLIPKATHIQNGLNTYTAGTASLPTVNVSGLTIDNINVSGSAIFNTLSAVTLSASTIYSGSTNIYDMFAKTGTTGQFIEVYTASTTWNVPSDVTSVVVEMFGGGGGGGCGAGVNYGGGGGASGSYILGTVTVSPGSAMTITVGSGGTGGYAASSPNPNGISATNGGDTIFGSLIASGGTFGTNSNWNTPNSGGVGGIAKSINGNDVYYASNYFFARGFDGQDQTGIPSTSSKAGGGGGDVPMFGRIKMLPRLNGSTQAGTGGLQTLVDVPKVGDNAVFVGGGGAGGTGMFSSLGATGGTGSPGMIIIRYNKGTGSVYNYTNVFSGGTITGATNFLNTISSGGTDLSLLFATPANITDLSNKLATKANLSGATFTGAVIAPSISATTISGGTIYSGNTELGSLFATPANITLINSQLSTKIDKSGDTWTNILRGTALSATTLSGGTIYSGNTDVSTLFATPANITDLSNRLDTKANLSGATFTGTINTGILSATTLSATTYYSASTELGSVIQRMITGVTSGITGSITSGTSYGNATHVFSGVTGTYLAFKSLSAGTNITLTNGDAITINSTASSANNTLPFNLGVAASDETTALSTGNAKITFLTPRTGSLTKIVAGLSTSGSTTTSVRVNKNGVVVGTSTIDITANNFSSSITTPVLTATTFTAWDTYTVDITAAGTGAKGLKVYFEGNYSNPFTATTSTIPWQLGLAMSDETTSITTGTAKVTMLTPFSGTVTGVTISLSTSGSTLTTVNIKNNGTTMFSTKPTIDANEFSSQTAATPPVITGSTWNVYDTLTFDIDGAGTGAKGLKVWFTGTRNI